MLVILEGCDGSGKTTLIEQIRKQVKRYFWICRSSHPPTDVHQVWAFLRTFEGRPSPKMGLLFDRHPLISEPIYGPILREIDLLGLSRNYGKWSRALGQHLHKIESAPIIIYCRPSIETIARNVQKNAPDQLAGVVERVHSLTDAYDRFFEQLEDRLEGIHLLRYDYTVPGAFEALLEYFPRYLPQESVDE